MSPAQAGKIASHLRALRAEGAITPQVYACADALLWTARDHGRWDCQISLKDLARLAGVCRETARKACDTLISLGFIAKTRTRVRAWWGRNRAETASRQTANIWRFFAPITEATKRAADSGLDILVGQVEARIVRDSPMESAFARWAAMLTGQERRMA